MRSKLLELPTKEFKEYQEYCFPGIDFSEICEKLMDLKSIDELSLKEKTIFWNGINNIAYWTKIYKNTQKK